MIILEYTLIKNIKNFKKGKLFHLERLKRYLWQKTIGISQGKR